MYGSSCSLSRVPEDRCSEWDAPEEREPIDHGVWVVSATVLLESSTVGSDAIGKIDLFFVPDVERDVEVTSSRMPKRVFDLGDANVGDFHVGWWWVWDLCFPNWSEACPPSSGCEAQPT